MNRKVRRMRVRGVSGFVFALVLWALSGLGVDAAEGPCPNGEPLAFPTAEGFGRCAKGGRGGRVIEVTNLNDSGPGSLAACVAATGPRTCVFRVGGTIDLKGKNLAVDQPFLTIAGQTAPGDGIQIKGGGLRIATSQVVVRYLRLRPGVWGLTGDNNDAMQIVGADTGVVSDVMIDHCSLSWGVDETASVWAWKQGVVNVTYQWNFITESLNCANHSEGCHGKGFLAGAGAPTLSFHHNLLAHHPDRNPYVHSGYFDFVNNVIYNYVTSANFQPASGLLRINAVGNYYLRGPQSRTDLYGPLRIWGAQPFSADSAIYLKGNIEPVSRPDNGRPETDIIRNIDGGFSIVTGRFNYPQVVATDAFRALDDVPKKAGATLPRRDTVDLRIVNDLKNKTGKIIDHPSQVGSWPPFSSGTAPLDTDRDGMPDTWELARGLNPNNPNDGAIRTASGYTHLENYLNELAGDPVSSSPAPPQNLRVK